MAQTVTTKRLIKGIVVELSVMMLISIVLLGITFWVSGTSDEKEKQASQIGNDIGSKTGELQTIKAKMAQFKNAAPLRASLEDSEGKVNLNLNRDTATNVFLELKDKYVLKDVKINITPIKIMTEQIFVKPTMQVINSDVNITMKAYSDVQIVNFINDISNKLPGVIKIKKVSLTRGTEKTLKDGSATNTSSQEKSFNDPLLDIKIDLIWYGLQDINKQDTANPTGVPAAAPTSTPATPVPPSEGGAS